MESGSVAMWVCIHITVVVHAFPIEPERFYAYQTLYKNYRNEYFNAGNYPACFDR